MCHPGRSPPNGVFKWNISQFRSRSRCFRATLSFKSGQSVRINTRQRLAVFVADHRLVRRRLGPARETGDREEGDSWFLVSHGSISLQVLQSTAIAVGRGQAQAIMDRGQVAASRLIPHFQQALNWPSSFSPHLGQVQACRASDEGCRQASHSSTALR